MRMWEACEGFAMVCPSAWQTRPYTRRAARPPSAAAWGIVIIPLSCFSMCFHVFHVFPCFFPCFSIQMSCILQFVRVPDSGRACCAVIVLVRCGRTAPQANMFSYEVFWGLWTLKLFEWAIQGAWMAVPTGSFAQIFYFDLTIMQDLGP